jgi:predicted dehydrogenase
VAPRSGDGEAAPEGLFVRQSITVEKDFYDHVARRRCRRRGEHLLRPSARAHAIGAEVVGVQDVNQERVRLVAAELGCRVHRTLPELLAEEADRMLAEAERRGRVLAVAFRHRTWLEVREAPPQLVADGVWSSERLARELQPWLEP